MLIGSHKNSYQNVLGQNVRKFALLLNVLIVPMDIWLFTRHYAFARLHSSE